MGAQWFSGRVLESRPRGRGSKIVNEYDQEIPQSQTADNPWHHEEEPLKPQGRHCVVSLSKTHLS